MNHRSKKHRNTKQSKPLQSLCAKKLVTKSFFGYDIYQCRQDNCSGQHIWQKDAEHQNITNFFLRRRRLEKSCFLFHKVHNEFFHHPLFISINTFFNIVPVSVFKYFISNSFLRFYDIYYYTHLFLKKGYILFTVGCHYLSVPLQSDNNPSESRPFQRTWQSVFLTIKLIVKTLSDESSICAIVHTLPFEFI